jgi:hypothetical protein
MSSDRSVTYVPGWTTPKTVRSIGHLKQYICVTGFVQRTPASEVFSTQLLDARNWKFRIETLLVTLEK